MPWKLYNYHAKHVDETVLRATYLRNLTSINELYFNDVIKNKCTFVLFVLKFASTIEDVEEKKKFVLEHIQKNIALLPKVRL
jgi:hypothetical protein